MLKKKSEALGDFKKFKMPIESKKSPKISCLRIDTGR